MTKIYVKPTDTTPELIFDYDANAYSIIGESYPENVRDFYGEPVRELKEHLLELQDTSVTFTFSFRYFHSSTARILIGLFETLEACAVKGNTVRVLWRYEVEDENMEEMGEEFGECLSAAKFEPQPFAEA